MAEPSGKPVKMAVLPKLICRINTILKTLAVLFARGGWGESGGGVRETGKLILKSTWRYRWLRAAMATLCYQNL